MRIVGEIPHPDCKITLYSWNNRYLVKLEKGLLEQTYKVNQFDIADENKLPGMVNEEFIRQTIAIFESMEAAWNHTLLKQ
ncbi:MAG: hypothetical protein L6Q51_08640 [Cyclobacteriaceae bacterium]|nr:hypothetical protein [Cyclobacteriaceae bacterium]